MTKAARVFGRDETEIYRENIGRIPMWAWKVPHHMEAGISTPIAEGRSANPTTGVVIINMANDFNVAIRKDVFNVPELGNKAETRIHISSEILNFDAKMGPDSRITSITHLFLFPVEIQTF
jgi:hypothetical protein